MLKCLYAIFATVAGTVGSAFLPLRTCPDLAAPMLDYQRLSMSRDALFPAPSHIPPVLVAAVVLQIGNFPDPEATMQHF